MTTSNGMKTGAKLVTALFLLGVIFSLFPASLSAQVRYRREPSTGALYLLPNGGSSTTFPRQPIASGLVVSCAPTSIQSSVGQPITWFSSVTGGAGSYLYAWNGTDGLLGNGSTAAKIYTSNGDKFATLTVTSGNQSVTVSCGSVRIGGAVFQQVQSGFGASCYATPERVMPGESVTWLAIVSGVTASSTFMWDGTDNLSGDRPLITKTYTTNGVKSALLTVTDGHARIVAACTNSVTVGPRFVASAPKPVAPAAPATTPSATTTQTLDVQAICAPSATTATTDDEVVWQVAAVGGSGSFSYLWSGDEDLTGTTTTAVKRYETVGAKTASVTISSGDKVTTLACTPVEIGKRTNGLFAGGFFSWAGGPLCFVLAAILAIIIGISIARRKRAKEDEESEQDYKPNRPSPPSNQEH